MEAWVLAAPGGIDQLSIKEIADPQPKSKEVVVGVQAIGINPVDIKTRKGGALYNAMKEDGDVILGWDISGIVLQTGNEVTKFKKGDAVFGMIYFPGHGKAYAEKVVALEDHLAGKPDRIDHVAAAATTLAALTAWQVLVQQAQIRSGQKLLIHAAAGGVGHFAVQMAKHFGATVYGTASGANEYFLKELGVDHFIDYKKDRFEEIVSDIDMVLDPIGGETTERSLHVLKAGGTLISIVGGVKDHLQRSIADKNINAKNYLVHSSGDDMEQLAALLKEGIMIPAVSHTYAFDELPRAHEQIETGRTRGKLVVTI